MLFDGYWSAGEQTKRAAAKAIIAVTRSQAENCRLFVLSFGALYSLQSVIKGEPAKEVMSVALSCT